MPADTPPAAISGETTPTLPEADAPSEPEPEPEAERITAVEKRITAMSEADKAELERRRAADGAPPVQAPAFQITQKQLTGLGSVLTVIIGLLGSGGYIALDSQVAGHVDSTVDDKVADKVVEDTKARDEEHRKVVSEELGKVMIEVNARVDKDREGFSKQITDISESVEALDKRMAEQEKATAAQRVEFETGLKGIEAQQTKTTATIIEAIKASKDP